ncbi:MAG: hypothetical protein HQL82_08730 [Magnetococcales bacterium]|nr:hypothetical protein [Magnetococcales bacterium]
MLSPFPGSWWSASFWLAAILAVAGCATPSMPDFRSPSPPVGETRVDPGLVLDRFARDQARRRTPRWSQWRLSGVLDMDTEVNKRRNRFVLDGTGTTRARLAVYGPFQQVASRLLLDGGVMQLEESRNGARKRVPATAAGMESLIGLALPPERLLEVFLGQAATPTALHVRPDGTLWGPTSRGEWLRVGPASGLLLERRGRTSGGHMYAVGYRWAAIPGGLHMPAQVEIRLGQDAKVEMDSGQWTFN